MCRSCQSVHALLGCTRMCFLCVRTCVRVCVYEAYGEGRNLGIRTRRGPCVASSRACRTDKGWDLTAALPVQGRRRGRAGHGQDQAGVQYSSLRHLHRRDKRGHLHRPDDAKQADWQYTAIASHQRRRSAGPSAGIREKTSQPWSCWVSGSESRFHGSTAPFHSSTSPLLSFVHLLARLIGTPLVSPN